MHFGRFPESYLDDGDAGVCEKLLGDNTDTLGQCFQRWDGRPTNKLGVRDWR